MNRPTIRLRRARPPEERGSRAGGLRHTPISYVCLIALCLFSGLPMLILLANSFKSEIELGRNPLGWPSHFIFSNYSQAWEKGGIAQGMLNSLILVVGTVIGVWICAGGASYALARLDAPFKRSIQLYLFVVISLPVQLFLVPLFFLWSRLGLVNTLPGLMIIYIGLNTPFATLLLRAFMVRIPRELEEAARLDGANEWIIATRVILPLARHGILTVGLVVGLSVYNELLFAITFIIDPNRLPIATAFLQFSQGHSQLFGLVNAAGVITILPVAILFLLMQRRFISGLATGSLKG
jgi:raffinose/stachyose/melibiose transport system permease protein